MALYAIADLHLGFAVDKPMHIFGQHWLNHEQLISRQWRETVTEKDTVLIPGDISWAMRLHEVLADLQFINALPGTKILLRGNHDYWWPSMAKLQQLCDEHQFSTLQFLKNNSLRAAPDTLICGTRGWVLPGDTDFRLEDEKIYNRELGRLTLSLQDAAASRTKNDRLIVCLHFPPFPKSREETDMIKLMAQYQVDLCVYGHIHGESPESTTPSRIGGVLCQLTAADALGFKPLRL